MNSDTYSSCEDTWKSLEDEWPENQDEELIFYNQYLDFYEILTFNQMEKEFKRYKQCFDHLIQKSQDHPDFQKWVQYRYRFTDWSRFQRKK